MTVKTRDNIKREHWDRLKEAIALESQASAFNHKAKMIRKEISKDLLSAGGLEWGDVVRDKFSQKEFLIENVKAATTQLFVYVQGAPMKKDGTPSNMTWISSSLEEIVKVRHYGKNVKKDTDRA